jgi:hypothetical protein
VDGSYEAIEPDSLGHLWSEHLGLFLGIDDRLLRFFWPDEVMVPTPEEFAEMVIVESNFRRQNAEAERQRADLLEEKLSALRIESDEKTR